MRFAGRGVDTLGGPGGRVDVGIIVGFVELVGTTTEQCSSRLSSSCSSVLLSPVIAGSVLFTIRRTSAIRIGRRHSSPPSPGATPRAAFASARFERRSHVHDRKLHRRLWASARPSTSTGCHDEESPMPEAWTDLDSTSDVCPSTGTKWIVIKSTGAAPTIERDDRCRLPVATDPRHQPAGTLAFFEGEFKATKSTYDRRSRHSGRATTNATTAQRARSMVTSGCFTAV